MCRALQLIAAALVVLWVSMIAAPLVFGSPECTCPDCHGRFCAVKKPVAQASQQPGQFSCHQKAPSRQSFRKGPCHHEVTAGLFTYQAVLPEADRNTQQFAQPAAAVSMPHFTPGDSLPDTPPPKQLSL